MAWREREFWGIVQLFGRCDLGPTDLGVFSVLSYLADEQGCVDNSITDIALRCHITRPTAGKVIKALERVGFIRLEGRRIVLKGGVADTSQEAQDDIMAKGQENTGAIRRKGGGEHALLREYQVIAGDGRPVPIYEKQRHILLGTFKGMKNQGTKRAEIVEAMRLAKERGFILDVWRFVRELPTLIVQVRSGYVADKVIEDEVAVADGGDWAWE